MAYISSFEKFGLEQGFKQGIERGIEQGKAAGISEGRIEIAQRLLAEKFEIKFAAKMTDLSEEQIINLQTEITAA